MPLTHSANFVLHTIIIIIIIIIKLTISKLTATQIQFISAIQKYCHGPSHLLSTFNLC